MKTATRIYAGGDNLWKWYGHEYVKSQMKNMYNNVDDIAKWTKEITGREFQSLIHLLVLEKILNKQLMKQLHGK